MLDHGFFTMERVNLLILDECHHAIGKSSYKQIMTRYAERKERGDPVPRILGLSASIVVKKPKDREKFKEEKARLEQTLDAKVVTTEDLADLLKHVTAPKERLEGYNSAGFRFAAQVRIEIGSNLFSSKNFTISLLQSKVQELDRIEERCLDGLEQAKRRAIGLLRTDDIIAFKLDEQGYNEKHSKTRKLVTNMLQMLRDLGK